MHIFPPYATRAKKFANLRAHQTNVESAAGLDGVGDELAVEAVLVSSTSIIVHADGN